MEQFFAVAAAHFLALLIPGVDFFVIVRAATAAGWRRATGACLGIAVANGVFIVAAFSGLSLVTNGVLLATIQLSGGCFLVVMGVAFVRSSGRVARGAPRGPSGARADPDPLRQPPTSWGRNFGLGLASGLLNPKNALFYVSLAAAVSTTRPAALIAYGVWMFTVVLCWDVFVAAAFGAGRALTRLRRALPWITRLAGAFLVVFGIGMLGRLALGGNLG